MQQKSTFSSNNENLKGFYLLNISKEIVELILVI